MAAPPLFLLPTAALAFLLVSSLIIIPTSPKLAHSQPEEDYNESNPTVTECEPRLLPLAPCTTFVQGMSLYPGQACCDNLRQLYYTEFSCLCLLLSDSTLTSIPINRTKALQLPVLCDLGANPISTCSGVPVHVPSSSPAFHPPRNGNERNSTFAAAPTVTRAPTTTFRGTLPGSSSGAKLNEVNLLGLAFLTAMAFYVEFLIF